MSLRSTCLSHPSAGQWNMLHSPCSALLGRGDTCAVCRSQRSFLNVVLQVPSTLFLWDKVSLAWSSQWQNLIANETQGSACLYLPSAVIIIMSCYVHISPRWIRSLYLESKYFTDWTILPSWFIIINIQLNEPCNLNRCVLKVLFISINWQQWWFSFMHDSARLHNQSCYNSNIHSVLNVIKPFPSGLRELCARESKKSVKARKDGWHQKDSAF